MATVYACTMAIARACTVAIVKVSCSKWVMFDEIHGVWTAGRSTVEVQGGLGAAGLPNRGKALEKLWEPSSNQNQHFDQI